MKKGTHETPRVFQPEEPDSLEVHVSPRRPRQTLEEMFIESLLLDTIEEGSDEDEEDDGDDEDDEDETEAHFLGELNQFQACAISNTSWF